MPKRTLGSIIIVALALALALALATSACGAPRTPTTGDTQPQAGRPSAPIRITAAIRGNPHAAAHKLNVGNNFIGSQQLERLVNAGFAVPDPQDVLQPQLAEAVPSLENGLWRLLPDGRMETTWRIRAGVTWHDGTPLTADDVVFAARVEQDRELASVRNVAYDAVESVEALDPQTVIVKWRRPFVDADAMFSSTNQRGLPLPRHLLGRAYAEDKAGFLQLPYWNVSFVGTGPFKVREWALDDHIILEGFDHYVLGRPKIGEIEIRLIPDTNTVMANILAGAVEYTMDGRTIPLEEGRNVKEQWRDGRMELSTGGVPTIFPQFLNASPPIITDVRFRRALMYAMDRQDMVAASKAGSPPSRTRISGPSTATTTRSSR